ncbi:MAG: hypothetical protein HY796_01760 [Elusimicrobia bacterium]|nr:hypothetical protein [Elusimicrobiota bacterium]
MKRPAVIAAFMRLFILSPVFVMGGRSSSKPCPSCSSAVKPVSATEQQSSSKKQSTTKKICSSIIGILKNAIGKTKSKTKLDILKGGLNYANDVCDSGGAPDLAKITKGLPEKDKARISQKTNAALFDGAAELPDKDFGPVPSSNRAAVLTGKGGMIGDLKVSEPDINKLSPVTEFSLSGKKSSRETFGQAATKQSLLLLSPAASAKSPADAAASAKTAVAATAQAQSSGATPDDTLYNKWKTTNDLQCDIHTQVLEVGRNNSAAIPHAIAAGEILCSQGDFGIYKSLEGCLYGRVTEQERALREAHQLVWNADKQTKEYCHMPPGLAGESALCVIARNELRISTMSKEVVLGEKDFWEQEYDICNKEKVPAGIQKRTCEDKTPALNDRLLLIEAAIKAANSEIEKSCKQTPAKKPWWENIKNFLESLISGEGDLPGRELGRQYLREAKGNVEAALKLIMQARDARNWESLTPEGAKLRDAENYLAAYWAVSKGQFLSPEFTWPAYMMIGVPGWQVVHVLGEAANWWGGLFGIEFNFFPNDPPSWDALFAGWAGATDALTKRKK